MRRGRTGAVSCRSRGAWRPGDPVGRRQFLALPDGRPFVLEGGGQLRGVAVAYETWGELDPAGANAMLVCHAVTGDSHVTGRSAPAIRRPAGGTRMVGPGRPLDTDRYFVVCVNVLGGCQGSTGPSSVDPATGRPYGGAFPVVSVRDMVRCPGRGGRPPRDPPVAGAWSAARSGGMQVLEWGVMYPLRVRSLVPIATTAAATAWQIAFSRVGRLAVQLDPKWRGGDYYDAGPGRRPPRRPRPGPDDRPHHLPQRRRSTRPASAATGSSCSRSSSWSSASRSRATSTTRARSSSAASTPTATCGSTRRWTCTTWAATGAVPLRALQPDPGADPEPEHLQRHALPAATSRRRSTPPCWPAAPPATTSPSTAPTATTASSSRPTPWVRCSMSS